MVQSKINFDAHCLFIYSFFKFYNSFCVWMAAIISVQHIPTEQILESRRTKKDCSYEEIIGTTPNFF
jgi:hypothetical protein